MVVVIWAIQWGGQCGQRRRVLRLCARRCRSASGIAPWCSDGLIPAALLVLPGAAPLPCVGAHGVFQPWERVNSGCKNTAQAVLGEGG